MKKFYAQIFIAAFLLTGLCSQAQLYTSINPNTGNFTFDDPRFWVGSVRPPNPCTGCVINVNSTTTLPSTSSNIPSTVIGNPLATSVFNGIDPTISSICECRSRCSRSPDRRNEISGFGTRSDNRNKFLAGTYNEWESYGGFVRKWRRRSACDSYSC